MFLQYFFYGIFNFLGAPGSVLFGLKPRGYGDVLVKIDGYYKMSFLYVFEVREHRTTFRESIIVVDTFSC